MKNGDLEVMIARIDERTRALNDKFDALEHRINNDFVSQQDFRVLREEVRTNTKTRNWMIATIATMFLSLLGTMFWLISEHVFGL